MVYFLSYGGLKKGRHGREAQFYNLIFEIFPAVKFISNLQKKMIVILGNT